MRHSMTAPSPPMAPMLIPLSVTRTAPAFPARTRTSRCAESWIVCPDAMIPPEMPASGDIAAEGDDIDLSSTRDLRIRVGNAGAVRITINGIGLGTMGANGQVVEWRVTRAEE